MIGVQINKQKNTKLLCFTVKYLYTAKLLTAVRWRSVDVPSRESVHARVTESRAQGTGVGRDIR